MLSNLPWVERGFRWLGTDQAEAILLCCGQRFYAALSNAFPSSPWIATSPKGLHRSEGALLDPLEWGLSAPSLTLPSCKQVMMCGPLTTSLSTRAS